MKISSATQATADACLRAALRADAVAARAGRASSMAALILALLVRLFGRTEAAWVLSPTYPTHRATTPRAPYLDSPNLGDPRRDVITMPVCGRAPHAACIEAARLPDWILPGIRNRGMRASPHFAKPRRNTRPARAPPPVCSTSS